MHQYSYRLLSIPLFIVSLLVCVLTIQGCKKEQHTGDVPLISFIPVNGEVVSDTALAPGGSIRISLKALGGGANITYFGVTMNDGQVHYVLDSGMNNANLSYSTPIFKGNSPVEHWTFTVMNRDRQKSSISIVLTKAAVSHWGKINTYDPVILGAQGNTTNGGFFSLESGHVYNYQQAEALQANMDLIYYYGAYEATLSSPLESEAPGYFPGLNNWSVRNETRYDTTSLTPAAFTSAMNDSLLLVSYEPVNGKRKAKFLRPGMVVSFRNQSGKTGLLLVRNLAGGETGKVECVLKVQQ